MDSVYMYDPDGSLVEVAVYRKEQMLTNQHLLTYNTHRIKL